MRDMTKKAVEAIDTARLEMAGIEGVLTWVQHLADRNKEGDSSEIKRIAQEQREVLTKVRMSLNKSMLDDSFSPFGFDLKDE